MAHWEHSLVENIARFMGDSPASANFLHTGQLHLAVLIEPYLSLIMDGTKTVESRFCRRKWVPYEMVNANDTLILKRSSGPVVGICKVAEVLFYDLSQMSLDSIRQRYGKAIAAPPSFWEYQKQAQFVSLFRLSHVMPLPNIVCHKGKGDRRAWVPIARHVSKKESSPAEAAREMIRHQFAVSFNPALKSN